MSTPVDTNATTVRKSVTVNAAIERAFDVFVNRFDTWWPRSPHVGEADPVAFTIEPRVGGRWFERGADGTECDTGTVLEIDPPNFLALSWHLNGDFKQDFDPEHSSRVDIRFTATSPTSTLVELTHSQLDRHGESWVRLRDGIDSDGGWGALLAMFAEVASA